MIPDINRREWYKLVKGIIQYDFANYVLSLQVTSLRRAIAKGKTTPEDAIKELHQMCTKYEKAVKKDLEAIFRDYIYTPTPETKTNE